MRYLLAAASCAAAAVAYAVVASDGAESSVPVVCAAVWAFCAGVWLTFWVTPFDVEVVEATELLKLMKLIHEITGRRHDSDATDGPAGGTPGEGDGEVRQAGTR